MKPTSLHSLTGRADLGLAALMFAIVVVLVAPMPAAVLDGLIVLSLLSSLGMLLMAARVQSPLQLLTFPALLLITTLFRLSLNVASTKMVLVEGQAGHVIETFGRAVVGGNLLAGICVFVIVALVQLLVVAKGSERAAEVAARFALDAMPGKQMAIDADLRSGSMDASEGKSNRAQLDIESRLFGGMDGAMKFVKGDAIAGLVIAAINIVGGLASGMLYGGLGFSDALHRYTVLSVGDALVSQIPSLLVALASGLLITRVTAVRTDTRSLASQIAGELSQHRIVMWQLAGVCAVAAAVPGMPSAVLLVFALTAASLTAWASSRARRGTDRVRHRQVELDAVRLRSFAPIGLEEVPMLLGPTNRFDAAITVTMPDSALRRLDVQRLDDAVHAVRERLAADGHLGFPGMALKRVDTGSPSAVVPVGLIVSGAPWAHFEWPLEQALHAPRRGWWMKDAGMPPGAASASWVRAGSVAGSLAIEEVIAQAVESACRIEPAALLTAPVVDALMQALRPTHGSLVTAVMESVPLQKLTTLLTRLAAEGVTLGSLPVVLNRIGAMLHDDGGSGFEEFVEQVLGMLSDLRCPEAMSRGSIDVHMVGPVLGRMIGASIRRELVFLPAHREAMRAQFIAALQRHGDSAEPLIVVCDTEIRSVVAAGAASIDPRLRVFAFHSIPVRLRIVEKGSIEIEAEETSESESAQGWATWGDTQTGTGSHGDSDKGMATDALDSDSTAGDLFPAFDDASPVPVSDRTRRSTHRVVPLPVRRSA